MAIRSRICFILAVLSSMAATALGQNQTEVVIPAETIGAARWLDRYQIPIWAGSRNSSINESRNLQFYYKPIVLPLRDEKGAPLFRQTQDKKELRLQCRFMPEPVTPLVLAEVRRKYAQEGDAANQITASDIQSLPLESISFEVEGLAPEMGRVRSPVELTNDLMFDVVIDTNPETIDNLKAWLSERTIKYTVKHNVRQITQNSVKITFSNLSNSTFKAALDGIPGNSVNVTRGDVRDLLKNVAAEIRIDYRIEDPKRFSATLTESMIDRIAQRQKIDLEQFDEAMVASTYHADDLRPDNVKTFFQKTFEKESGGTNWRIHGDGRARGGVNILDIVEGEGELSGSYTEEKLRTWLNERGFEVNIEGDLVVPKSMSVLRFNKSLFNTSYEIADVRNYVSEKGSMSRPDYIPLSVVPGDPRALGIAERVAILEDNTRSMIPIGTVAAFAVALPQPGPLRQDWEKQSGWLCCDGRELPGEPNYAALRHALSDGAVPRGETVKLPDLRGVFLRGVNDSRDDGWKDPEMDSRTGQDGISKHSAVGSYQWHALRDHSHDVEIPGGTTEAGPYGVVIAINTKPVAYHSTRVKGVSTIHLSAHETRPTNIAVYWLIRYR